MTRSTTITTGSAPAACGQPHLALEQGAAGDRKGRAQAAAGVVGFVIGGDQCGQSHESLPMRVGIEGRRRFEKP